MKALVLEIRNGEAAVLREDGVVEKVRRKCAVGETIELTASVRGLSARRYRGIAAVAAAAVLVFSSFSVYAYQNLLPYSYVSLDVNPSIEFTLNYRNRILDISSLNEDAEELVRSLEGKIKKRATISEALAVLEEESIWPAGSSLGQNPEQPETALINESISPAGGSPGQDSEQQETALINESISLAGASPGQNSEQQETTLIKENEGNGVSGIAGEAVETNVGSSREYVLLSIASSSEGKRRQIRNEIEEAFSGREDGWELYLTEAEMADRKEARRLGLSTGRYGAMREIQSGQGGMDPERLLVEEDGSWKLNASVLKEGKKTADERAGSMDVAAASVIDEAAALGTDEAAASTAGKADDGLMGGVSNGRTGNETGLGRREEEFAEAVKNCPVDELLFMAGRIELPPEQGAGSPEIFAKDEGPDGAAEAAGKADDAAEAAGRPDGAAEAAGKADGAAEAAGRPDGAAEAAGRPDGAAEAAGRPDGAAEAAGRPDGAAEAAGRPDSSAEAVGKSNGNDGLDRPDARDGDAGKMDRPDMQDGDTGKDAMPDVDGSGKPATPDDGSKNPTRSDGSPENPARTDGGSAGADDDFERANRQETGFGMPENFDYAGVEGNSSAAEESSKREGIDQGKGSVQADGRPFENEGEPGDGDAVSPGGADRGNGSAGDHGVLNLAGTGDAGSQENSEDMGISGSPENGEGTGTLSALEGSEGTGLFGSPENTEDTGLPDASENPEESNTDGNDIVSEEVIGPGKDIHMGGTAGSESAGNPEAFDASEGMGDAPPSSDSTGFRDSSGSETNVVSFGDGEGDAGGGFDLHEAGQDAASPEFGSDSSSEIKEGMGDFDGNEQGITANDQGQGGSGAGDTGGQELGGSGSGDSAGREPGGNGSVDSAGQARDGSGSGDFGGREHGGGRDGGAGSSGGGGHEGGGRR